MILCISHAGDVAESNVVTDLRTAVTNARRWKIVTIDGSGKHTTFRVDSTLISAGNLLIPGDVALISKSILACWNHEDRSDSRSAIFVQEFKIVGQNPVPDESLVGPTQSKHVVPANAKKKVSHKKKKQRSDAEASITLCECTGNLCSKNGVEFLTCLATFVPVKFISLELVARECVFATKELSDMLPNKEKNVCYYFHSITIYQFRGKVNRVELPECVKLAVRKLYPNE